MNINVYYLLYIETLELSHTYNKTLLTQTSRGQGNDFELSGILRYTAKLYRTHSPIDLKFTSCYEMQ